MKKFAVILTLLLFAFAAYAVDKGPAVMDLSKRFNVPKTTKKVVKFPHAFHQSKNKCTECHMTAEGGKGTLKNQKTGGKFDPGVVKGTSNKVHKEFCWVCHKKKKVKKGKSCKTCHK